jgi:hypothetical protein
MTGYSAVTGAQGAYAQGDAARQFGQYQSAVARNNAIIAERAATNARERGAEAARQSDVKTKQLIGRQRAVLASNGVLVDQDSALDITSDTAALGRMDALTLKGNAEREAIGYETQAGNYQSEAQMALLKGDAAYAAGVYGGNTTLLSGIGTVAARWYSFKKEGLGPSWMV